VARTATALGERTNRESSRKPQGRLVHYWATARNGPGPDMAGDAKRLMGFEPTTLLHGKRGRQKRKKGRKPL
jgi:hypothetical protein